MRKRHLQTTPLSKPKQLAAAGDYAVIRVCAEQHSLNPSRRTYYDLQGRVALWNPSRWKRYMEVTLDQDAKEQDIAVTDVKQESKLALGLEHLHKLEQLGTDRDSTRTKQAL